MTPSTEMLITRLRDAPAALRWAVSQVPHDLWHLRPRADSWSAHEIAFHTRDIAALVYRVRIRRILAEADPELALFDEERWMAEHYDPATPMARILDELDQAHRDMAALLAQCSEADWERTGHHAEYGRRTVAWWARQAIAHAWEHAVQVLRVAQSLDDRRETRDGG